MICSQSKLFYLHKPSLHNFLCNKHAIIPKKKVSFSFLGHKHIQTILANSLLSGTSVACCFHWILEEYRILMWIAISFECCIKTRICQSTLPVCNSQCSQGKDYACIGFLGVSHLALSLAPAALDSFRIFTAGRVWVGCITSKITFYLPTKQS